MVPLDEELGLEPNQRVSNELKRAGCALAVFVPYGIAAVLLKLLTGIKVSHCSIWNWVQETGKREMEKLETELTALEAGGKPPLEPRESEIVSLSMVIGGDGVQVPFRPNGGSPEGKIKWKEVKIGIVARIKRFINRRKKEVTKIERKRVVAVLGNVEDLRDRLWLESLKQGIENSYPVIWLSDGSRGFWRIFSEKFSHRAQGILDFYHAAQNIWKAARIWLDGRTKKARQWFTLVRRLLRHGQPYQVINEITKPLREEENLSDDARKALENLLSYLGNHYQHIEVALLVNAIRNSVG